MCQESARKVAVKFIVNSDNCFMCKTNWSKTYSAGVEEFTSLDAANDAAKLRTKTPYKVYQFNSIGERIA